MASPASNTPCSESRASDTASAIRTDSGVRPAVSRAPRSERFAHRRRHSRYDVELEVMMDPECLHGERFVARCTSLSLGGMFLETEVSFAVGDGLRIWLTLPGRVHLLLVGQVRWTTDRGIGVQHAVLGARDTFELTEYLLTLR